MADEKEYYIGNGKKLEQFDGMAIQLNLTQFREAIKQNKHLIKKYTSKDGTENETIDIVCFPLKQENRTQHRTHSVKLSKPQEAKAEQPKQHKDESLPF
ncbi:MAG TPA: hypothetical protein PLQ57_04280 [Saprospiraceae bacterium]|nr:hypothetical protein [Saprospiraceae bacterium]